MQYSETKSFGRLRGFLWPIHGHEHKKLIPMFILFFLISFIYNVLRCMKVTLVVTAEGSGAQVIPYLKVWAVLPGALLLTYIYTKLSSRLTREMVFYTMIAIFLGFFTIFMIFIHPNRESLELTTFSQFLLEKLPKGLNGLVAVIRHWHLSLFYVLSELWSAMVLSMLFWGFANEITSVDEAKRFYAIFALGANSSGIFSGQCAQFLTLKHYNSHLPFGKEAWEQSLILQLGVVLFLGAIIVILFRWLNRRILPNIIAKTPVQTVTLEQAKELKAKPLSLMECFAHLAKSRYMAYIAIIVVAYNLVYNLSDVIWTEQIRAHYPSATEFNAYINRIASITGIFATISAVLLSGNVIRRFGWTTTALITPAIWLVTSIGFFGCLLLSNHSITDFMGALLGVPFYTLALMFGSAQICLGRAAKYTVFDESKEIAFIPLPKEDQRKGKAVVDGIASRFGKSGGSLGIQVLLLICGDLMLTIPYVAIIFGVVLAGWIFAVRRLGSIASQTIDQELQADAPIPLAASPVAQ